MRPMIMILLLITGIGVYAQPEPIDSFAVRGARAFVKAYEQRDTAGYGRLMRAWEQRYDPLPAAEKKRLLSYAINAWYNYACTYALLGRKGAALDCLERSLRVGYTNYTHIMNDPDLEGLHKEERFQIMMKPLRAVGDYLYILQRAGVYDTTDRRVLPAFTYQPASHPALQALRRGFNLDSIAGKGSEVSQVLSMLHWVHDLIPHDGNHENPAVKNAMQLIEVCRRDRRGLNCRGLATVLNEACLAMGYASRMVTCLPKDSLGTDSDCHVIDAVYIPTLRKWIWVDPTQNAYVMNERGELLGIGEVRERIVTGQRVIVNPDANWNHEVTATKEEYLYSYMAKNLYMLECATSSEYDYESRARGKTLSYVRLLPLDYFRQGPDKDETVDGTGTKWEIYKTNNVKLFWEAPLK